MTAADHHLLGQYLMDTGAEHLAAVQSIADVVHILRQALTVDGERREALIREASAAASDAGDAMKRSCRFAINFSQRIRGIETTDAC